METFIVHYGTIKFCQSPGKAGGSSGDFKWTRQIGTSGVDNGNGVSADGLGSVYIAGRTFGDLGEGGAAGYDAFISKFDADGVLDWTQQLGSNGADWGYGVTADGSGSVYLAGATYGGLGSPNEGKPDAYVSKYDTAGVLAWTRQIGTGYEDASRSVSVDGLGGVYISGYTAASLGESNAGGYDAFVAKFFTDVPLPPGDGNFDGVIDGLDFIIWATRFGDDPAASPPGSPSNGDYNNDGVVDGVDYVVWAQNYGQGPNEAVAVPEPGSLLMLTFGLFLIAARRR